jgi:hypothetical protein
LKEEIEERWVDFTGIRTIRVKEEFFLEILVVIVCMYGVFGRW